MTVNDHHIDSTVKVLRMLSQVSIRRKGRMMSCYHNENWEINMVDTRSMVRNVEVVTVFATFGVGQVGDVIRAGVVLTS